MGAFPFGHPPWIHWKQKFWALYVSWIWLRLLLGHISLKSFWKRLMSHSFKPTCVSWVKIEHTGFTFWFMDEICKFAFEKPLKHNSGKFELCRRMPVAGWDSDLFRFCLVQDQTWPGPPLTWISNKHAHALLLPPSPLTLLKTALLPLGWIKETGMENGLTWNFFYHR